MAKQDVDVDAGEQLQLLDTDHPARKPILRLCRAIKKHDAVRSDAQGKADELRDKLAELMHEHKLTRFAADKFDVSLKDLGERVSVKKRAAESNGDDGDDADDDGDE